MLYNRRRISQLSDLLMCSVCAATLDIQHPTQVANRQKGISFLMAHDFHSGQLSRNMTCGAIAHKSVRKKRCLFQSERCYVVPSMHLRRFYTGV